MKLSARQYRRNPVVEALAAYQSTGVTVHPKEDADIEVDVDYERNRARCPYVTLVLEGCAEVNETTDRQYSAKTRDLPSILDWAREVTESADAKRACLVAGRVRWTWNWDEMLVKAPGLDTLLEAARTRQLTDEDREAQRRSFAYGNAALENPRITRAVVDEQARLRPRTK